jgi:hypothetical protein
MVRRRIQSYQPPFGSAQGKLRTLRFTKEVGDEGNVPRPNWLGGNWVYVDLSCAGDLVNRISMTSKPAPTTMALSATLKAGHWYWPT